MASFAAVATPFFPPLPSPRRSLPSPKAFIPAPKLQARFQQASSNKRPSFFRHGIGSTATYWNQAGVVPTSVPVRLAHELLQAGHHYLDVRTVDEFNASHATGAINIPYVLKVGSGMTKNPNFLVEVSSVFRKDDEIIIGCRSGKRSLMAAAELTSAGFTGITDIAGGYSAWVQNRLPTEQ
ncbi:hypothetical protein OPV22_012266 [Ensete ventricosum]|uniref:Rhodanese domain-containing protein n=1 Tax=Ensete ventricosum TaxID=4639 RepID=A0AAV8QWQ9_ENSVE|nr:hypothetical protein OPV22_012266 [Ensete ventricosum]